MSQLRIRFQLLNDDRPRTLTAVGRDAWALQELLEAGPEGLTTLTRPAPRWSHYIWKLRRLGLLIETKHESHGGDFAGHHGRYRLLSKIQIIAVDCGESEAA